MGYCADDHMTTQDGDYSKPCCCDSVTGLPGGIHPDAIVSSSVDLVLRSGVLPTFANTVVCAEPGHIVSVTAALFTIQRDDAAGKDRQVKLPSTFQIGTQYGLTPVGCSLFTLPYYLTSDMTAGGWDADVAQEDGRTYIASFALNSYQPTWTLPPHLFGLFFDGGLFLEMNAPDDNLGIRVTVNYVPRAQFPPAYPDPVEVLQHYWTCSHPETEEFLEGFYGGVAFDVDSSLAISGPAPEPESSRVSNPASAIDSLNTVLSW